MTKNQFILIFSLLFIVSAFYVYDSVSSMVARGKCSDYALKQVGDSMKAAGLDFPPTMFKSEIIDTAKTSYDFFFEYCIDQREVAR